MKCRRRAAWLTSAFVSSTCTAVRTCLATDAELLRAHAAGERHAFEELFRRHRHRLYRVARQRSLTDEDADDAVQEAMLAAHRSAGSFRYDASVGSWLHRIVVNACQDRLRHNAIRPTTALTDDGCVQVTDRTAELETALLVRQALLRLPVDQRSAVVAVDMQGYSVADAAALLHVAEGTIKSRRARARARLAVLLCGLSPAA